MPDHDDVRPLPPILPAPARPGRDAHRIFGREVFARLPVEAADVELDAEASTRLRELLDRPHHPAAAAANVRAAIRALQAKRRQGRDGEPVIEPPTLGPNEARVLATLLRVGPAVSGRAVARIAGLNQSTAQRALVRLRTGGLVTVYPVPPSLLYQANVDHLAMPALRELLGMGLTRS